MGLFDRFKGKAKDPVCGMDVDKDKPAATETNGGKSYYFCSKGCATKFRANPANYA